MKAVLLSIRPEWCDLIIRGQKTIADAICDMDDEELAVILAMNGYTVSMGKEKRGGKSTLTYFVEYWRADNEG